MAWIAVIARDLVIAVIGRTKTLEAVGLDHPITRSLKQSCVSQLLLLDWPGGSPEVETRDKTAVLLGASGLVGGFCLQSLLADASYARIVLLARRPLKIAPDPRLIQRIISFENLSQGDFAFTPASTPARANVALSGGLNVDDVFCALGTTIAKAGSQAAFRRVDVDYPLTAAKLARQAGARQFVLVSSVGADAKAGNFYLRTKGELEQEIGKLGFEALHVFRPSLLLGKREESRRDERIMRAIAPLLNLVMIGGLRRYRGIAAATVGRAMVAAARQGPTGTFVYEYDEIIRLAGG